MRKEDLNLLVCPECKGKLQYIEEFHQIKCTECGKQYQLIEGIPILLTEKEAQNALRNNTYYDPD